MTSETIEMILEFRDRRDWKQFPDPKDPAIPSLWRPLRFWRFFRGAARMLSAWRSGIVSPELADILNYCVLTADRRGPDLDDIVRKKIEVNNRKYPADKACGKNNKCIEYGKEGEEC